MKISTIQVLFPFWVWFTCSYAQTTHTIPGYYITNSADTLATSIKLPRQWLSQSPNLIAFAEKVEVVDGEGSSRTFKVNDINGFGFFYQEKWYRFVSKDFGRETAFSASTHRFYQIIIQGPHTNLYHRLTTVDQSGHVLGIMYFLEQQDGKRQAITLVAGTKPDFIRKLLKQFYGDDLSLHECIDGKFQGKDFEAWQHDIIDIVTLANQL